MLEAVRDESLILRAPFGFLCLSLEVQLFFCHFIESQLSFLVIKLNESFDWLERRHNAYAAFTPCRHDKENAAFLRRPEIEVTRSRRPSIFASLSVPLL